MPDLISGTTLWEFKAITPFHPTPALGNGSANKGGAPSEADGHFIAHGNTLESITRITTLACFRACSNVIENIPAGCGSEQQQIVTPSIIGGRDSENFVVCSARDLAGE